MIDTKKIKKNFPIFDRKVNGKDLVYLDNAATSQKPRQVINTISSYYESNNANVHRGIHTLSEEASELYEKARKTVSEFVGAVRPKELVFTSGTTESLNMVAFGWGLKNIKSEDIILVGDIEHHSNLVPWQIVAKKTGAKLKVVSLSDAKKDPHTLLKEEMENKRVKILTIAHSSNVTGEIMPIKKITRTARENNVLVCVDGAQAVPHFEVNIQSLGCDFYTFSAHKMLGPTGIGALWAKIEHLEDMNPCMYGGGMINVVNEEESSWAELPEKLEPGTPNIAGAIGFAAAADYLTKLGMNIVREHEVKISKYALDKLSEIEGLKIIGPKDPKKRTGLVSFVIKDLHAHDISAVLDTEGVAVRSGHHCAMPLHDKLGITASTRASYYIYNTKEDIDVLIKGIEKAAEIL